jgi:hypothetical protein
MVLSKLSRAPSASRPRQPLTHPRFTSQSFNRSIRSPRYRAKNTKLLKTPKLPKTQEQGDKLFFDTRIPAFLSALHLGFFLGVFVCKTYQSTSTTHSVVPAVKTDRKETPKQNVVAHGSEEKSRQRDRERVPAYRPDYAQNKDEEWRRWRDGYLAYIRRPVPPQLSVELLHHK